MKLSHITLALLVAAPFAAANAGITITPLLGGYHWYPNATQNKQRDALPGRGNAASTGTVKNGTALESDAVFGAAVGVELTPWLQGEIEYQQTNTKAAANAKTHVNGQPWDAEQRTLSGNALITPFDALSALGVNTGLGDMLNKYNIRPYVMGGVGQSRITVDNPGFDRRSYDTIMNLGGGVLYELNDVLSLRGEARAVHNFDNNWWEGQALVGLQAVAGGHLRAAAPVVEVQPQPVVVQPQPVQPQVEPQPVQPVMVPKAVSAAYPVRVNFDLNKSVIKPQYKPEIQKLAGELSEDSSASALIMGHTSVDSKPERTRALNERLSLARANAAKAMLVNEFGVDGNRLETRGMGSSDPIFGTNPKDKEAQQQNRRISVIINRTRMVQQ